MTSGAARKLVVALVACVAVLADAGAVLIGRHGQDSHAVLLGFPRTALGVAMVGVGLSAAVVLAIVWLQIQRTEARHD